MSKRESHSFEFGAFRVIPAERQLLRGEEPVPLTPKTFDLLVLLVENSGHLMEKTELMKRLWADSFVDEANLSVNMSALRRALGEGANENHYIETVSRRGYRFVAPVQEFPAEASAASAGESLANDDRSPDPPSAGAAPTQSETPRGRWATLFAGVVVLAALVAMTAGGFRERFWAGSHAFEVDSIAVLPLASSSADPSRDYFEEGITEALINELAEVDALRVISRSAVMPYKNKRKTTAQIGRELNVDAVMTGSVSRARERVVIALQLVHVRTGRIVWEASYERDLRDVLRVVGEVRRGIVDKLKLPQPPQGAREASIQRVNPEAYDHYLRGQFHLHRQNARDNEAAIAALERAVTIDSRFAAAHAELAQAYVWKLYLFSPDEPQWAEKAFVAAEKALALDPDLAVAYLARGRILWTPANRFPHEKAIREYRRALALNPSLDEARNQLALVYSHVGAFDAALEEARKAELINPSNTLAQFRVAQTFNFQGRHEEALAALERLPQEVNPALIGHQMAWALFNLGRHAEAAAKLEQLLHDYPADTGGVFTSMQAVLAASSGDARLAEKKIAAAIDLGKGFGHFHHTAYHVASAYALMNKSDQAVKWLQVTADDGFPCYPLFERDPTLDTIRADARFVAFMASLKDQWEQYRGESEASASAR